jgi:death on curing protein
VSRKCATTASWSPQPHVPRPGAFGGDAYPDLDAKAAALLHSLARNHALADGDKRLALAGVIAFYGVNGRRLTLTNDDAYELIMSVAAGHLNTAGEIAARLRTATEARSRRSALNARSAAAEGV